MTVLVCANLRGAGAGLYDRAKPAVLAGTVASAGTPMAWYQRGAVSGFFIFIDFCRLVVVGLSVAL